MAIAKIIAKKFQEWLNTCFQTKFPISGETLQPFKFEGEKHNESKNSYSLILWIIF